MEEFVNNIADTTKHKYKRVGVRFFEISDKTDFKSLKDKKIEPGEVENPIAIYWWYKGKLIDKQKGERKSRS